MLNRLVAPRKAAGHNSDNDGKKYVYIEATSNEKKKQFEQEGSILFWLGT